MPENEKKQDAIAQSTRVRLARNYADVPFPGRMSPEQEEQIITRTENALQGERHTLRRMRDLSKNARGVLVEQHLISPELAAKDGGAVLLFEEGSASVMVGEEDHLRIQAMRPGLQLNEAIAQADRIDRTLERGERFAFDRSWGYLTACPTNTGTGMRASVMLHLAALTGIRPRSDANRASESRARNSLLVMSRALVNSPHERISLSVTCKRVCSINSSRAVRSR